MWLNFLKLPQGIFQYFTTISGAIFYANVLMILNYVTKDLSTSRLTENRMIRYFGEVWGNKEKKKEKSKSL